MSLLKPTPGEVIDRLSVVLLKISAATEKGWPSGHFLEELSLLSHWLSENLGWQISISIPEVAHLAQVNQLLWQKTEDQHNYQEELHGPHRGADLLVEIRNLNIERNRLREEIDKRLGTWKGAEKV